MVFKDWSHNLTKGLPVPPGEILPLRQDVRDLSEEQMYLYLEGLKKFQQVSKDEPLSYYKIAGIHGLPYENWPDPDNKTDIPRVGNKFEGFCTHTSIIFLTWHRPYLALFESALHRHVNKIASGIDPNHPKKKKYMDLAERFRIPYWDWARKDTQIVPKEALDPKDPAGGPLSLESISAPGGNYNPLYAYPFPEGTPEDITDRYKTTVRYPTSTKKNILTEMERLYNEPSTEKRHFPKLTPERNLTERTAWILQAYKSYVAMSKIEFKKGEDGKEIADAANWGSLEDIHNAVHVLVGGGGHMNHVPISAFDPIFWLHHTNIDRLFAIWQALHENDNDPNAFILPRPTGMGSFATKSGDYERIDTPLYPFRPTVDTWYDSSMVKRTEPFGYTYRETAGLKYPTTPADKTALMEIIGKMYAPLPKYIRQSKKHKRNAGEDLLPQAQILKEIAVKKVPATVEQLESLVEHLPDIDSLLETSLKPGKPFLRDLAPKNKYLEWITNIKAEKHTLDGEYTVHIFLGDTDETNVALWPASPNHVGTFAPLGQPSTTGCGKCQVDQRDHTEVTSQIPLTLALVERYLAGLIDDLSEKNVVPYLKKYLHWRVAKSDGTVLEDRSRVDGLRVFVVSNEVTIPEDETKLPIYAPDVKFYPTITTNEENNTGRGDGTGLTPDLVPS